MWDSAGSHGIEYGSFRHYAQFPGKEALDVNAGTRSCQYIDGFPVWHKTKSHWGRMQGGGQEILRNLRIRFRWRR